MRLDGDAALALEVHRVEDLVDRLLGVHRAGERQEPVGQRRLAVVDVGDDGEVADPLDGHRFRITRRRRAMRERPDGDQGQRRAWLRHRDVGTRARRRARRWAPAPIARRPRRRCSPGARRRRPPPPAPRARRPRCSRRGRPRSPSPITAFGPTRHAGPSAAPAPITQGLPRSRLGPNGAPSAIQRPPPRPGGRQRRGRRARPAGRAGPGGTPPGCRYRASSGRPHPAVARHAVVDERRKELPLDRHHRGRGDAGEQRAVQHIDAGVDRVGRDHPRRIGLLDEGADAAAGVQLHEAVLRRVGHARQVDGRAGLPLRMKGEHRAQVRVGEDVAVEHDHAAAGGRFHRVAHAAGGAERVELHRVPEAHAVGRAVAHRPADLVDQVGAGQDHVGDPVEREQRELVGEERDVEQRDDRLGPR